MPAALAVVTLTGTATYVWLTTVARPLSCGVKSSFHPSHGEGWREALPLALGIAGIATAVPAAAAVLLTMWAPAMAPHVIDSTWLTLGAVIGGAVWCARAAAVGIPRMPADLELALALAAVSLTTGDAARLSRAERRYHHYMLPGPVEPPYAVEQMHAI